MLYKGFGPCSAVLCKRDAMTGLNLESFLHLLRADLGAWVSLGLIVVVLADDLDKLGVARRSGSACAL